MLANKYRREGIPIKETFGVPYPEFFSHPIREYHAITHDLGVLDLTHWKVLSATGKDRTSFLNAMLTNDIAPLEKNQGCHSLITTTKGKIIAEVMVFQRESDVLLLVSQGDARAAVEILEKHIIMDDVTIEDLSSDFGVIAVEGPKADDALWRLFSTGPFPKGRFDGIDREFEDATVFVMNNSATGESGYHLLIPAHDIERLRNYTVDAARGSDGLPVGSIVWNIRRSESGLPWYRVDFTEDNFPQESRLESAVSYSKGCFLGQETLARLKYRGHVNRRLVGLVLEEENTPKSLAGLEFEPDSDLYTLDDAALRAKGRPVADLLDLTSAFPAGSPLYPTPATGNGAVEPKPIGSITSAVYSPRAKRPIFLGYVRPECAERGKELILETPGGRARVTVADLPL